MRPERPYYTCGLWNESICLHINGTRTSFQLYTFDRIFALSWQTLCSHLTHSLCVRQTIDYPSRLSDALHGSHFECENQFVLQLRPRPLGQHTSADFVCHECHERIYQNWFEQFIHFQRSKVLIYAKSKKSSSTSSHSPSVIGVD